MCNSDLNADTMCCRFKDYYRRSSVWGSKIKRIIIPNLSPEEEQAALSTRMSLPVN